MLSNPIYIPQSSNNNIMLLSSDLKISIILYQVDQLADPCLWDSNFTSVFLFNKEHYVIELARIFLKLKDLALLLRNLLQSSMNLNKINSQPKTIIGPFDNVSLLNLTETTSLLQRLTMVN